MSQVSQKKEKVLYGPNNNLPSDLIKTFNDQPNLILVTPDTTTAAHAVVHRNGQDYTSFTRARNKDRLQLMYWWNPRSHEGVGFVHIGNRAQGR
jgi:hypothetical protein